LQIMIYNPALAPPPAAAAASAGQQCPLLHLFPPNASTLVNKLRCSWGVELIITFYLKVLLQRWRTLGEDWGKRSAILA
jgi:hypothetical protein